MAFWEGSRRDMDSGTVMERPPLVSAKPTPAPVRNAMETDSLVEYIALAGEIGVAPPDLLIEEFKCLLRDADIPTFSLAEVVAYMDAKAARESRDKCGWEWHPLREKDHRPGISFGREAERHANSDILFQRPIGAGGRGDQSHAIRTVPASDFYRGPRARTSSVNITGSEPNYYIEPSPCAVYDKTVPLHALRKAAKIEKAFGRKVGLFVCDYALAPQIQYPDPFLMAVVTNPKLRSGVGRFIIDFWDEPGFGLEQMLKPAE